MNRLEFKFHNWYEACWETYPLKKIIDTYVSCLWIKSFLRKDKTLYWDVKQILRELREEIYARQATI